MNLSVRDQHCVRLSASLRILPERTAVTSSDFAGQAARLFSCFHAAFPWWPNPVPRRRLLSQPPSRCSAAASRETRLGPASLEPDAHQRLRAFVAEHPSSIHPRVSLVIDAGTPHRLISGGHRARHKQVPSRLGRVAFHLDLAIEAPAVRAVPGQIDRLAPSSRPRRLVRGSFAAGNPVNGRVPARGRRRHRQHWRRLAPASAPTLMGRVGP